MNLDCANTLPILTIYLVAVLVGAIAFKLKQKPYSSNCVFFGYSIGIYDTVCDTVYLFLQG